MGMLSIFQLYRILDSFHLEKKIFTDFVETGTYLGETIFEMEYFFDNLFTIEIQPQLYTNVKTK